MIRLLKNFTKCLIFRKTPIKSANFNSINQYRDLTEFIKRFRNMIDCTVYCDK